MYHRRRKGGAGGAGAPPPPIYFWRRQSPLNILGLILRCLAPPQSAMGGRVMIAFFVNYSTVAFPLHLPTLKRQQFFGAVANSLGKNSYFPLRLDVRRCVAPTGEEVDACQRGVN